MTSVTLGRIRRRGFTLIEVMVSLAIFALAAVVLGAAYVNLLNNYHAAYNVDPIDADLSIIRRTVLAAADKDDVEKGDDIVLPGDRQARWKATVDPTDVSDLFQVTLESDIPSQDDPSDMITHTETFLLLRPTWSEQSDHDTLLEAAKARLEKQRAQMR